MRKTHANWMLILPALCLGLSLAATAQTVAARQADEAAIKAAITEQADAWNRGNIDAFMSVYENSPETTFVGATTLNKGFQPILERYKKGYANRAQMGKLTFKDLEIRLLPSASGKIEYAVATGHFHLDRTERGSANRDDGVFSLVWRKTNGKWKILLDHTS
jgi:uncharacterized protein (TIGR02246 family)